MSRARAFGVASVVSIAALAGCAAVTIDPTPVRREVAGLVAERAGMDIDTSVGGPAERKARATMRRLLSDGLTAEEAVRIALLRNRDLRALYTDLDIAQSDLVQATLLHNPVLDAVAGFPVNGGAVDLSFGVALDVIDLVYVPMRKRVATAGLEQTKLRVAAAILELAWRTRTAVYRHQTDEQVLELRRQVAASTSASSELAHRMREAGNVTELAAASEAALAENAKLELRLAEIAARESREELNAVMGLWGEEAGAWTTSSRLPDPPATPPRTGRLETRAVERSLELAAAERLIVAAAENLGLDRVSGLFPEVIIGGEAEREGGQWERGPSFTLPLPLFDRGQARVARAAAELRRARETHHALAVRTRAVARSVRDRLFGHRDRALHYRYVQLPLRERVLRETELQYNAMQVGPLDLLRAKEQQIETAERYVEALREYWLADADLALILAGRLPPDEAAIVPRALEQLPRFPFPTVQ